MEFENSNKLKGYLKEESKRLNIHSNKIYTMYFLRTFIEKITRDNPERFVFVGGISQFANTQSLHRPITDADATSSLSISDSSYLIENILNQKTEPIKYQMKEKFITIRNVACLKILCHFDRIQHMIRLDISNEEQAYHQTVLPKILKKDQPIIISHLTLEQNIANKMYVILTELTKHHATSKDLRRFKDLYDLYNLIINNEYDLEKVKFHLALNYQKYEDLDPELVNPKYLNDQYIKNNKERYLKKAQDLSFKNDIPLEEVVEVNRQTIESAIKKK